MPALARPLHIEALLPQAGLVLLDQGQTRLWIESENLTQAQQDTQ
jgi:hypothetical protein